jgi:hypothetical protein
MFTFACASIEGLTLNQKRETLKALRASIQQEVASRKSLRALAAEAKAHDRLAKSLARDAKKAERIAKLEAKLSALKNPVGTKAVKANKKPGAVTITKYQAEAREANEIALKLAAKKKSA